MPPPPVPYTTSAYAKGLTHPISEGHPAVEVEVPLLICGVGRARVVVEARRERLRVVLVFRASVAPAPPVAHTRRRTRLRPLVPTSTVKLH